MEYGIGKQGMPYNTFSWVQFRIFMVNLSSDVNWKLWFVVLLSHSHTLVITLQSTFWESWSLHLPSAGWTLDESKQQGDIIYQHIPNIDTPHHHPKKQCQTGNDMWKQHHKCYIIGDSWSLYGVCPINIHWHTTMHKAINTFVRALWRTQKDRNWQF